MVRPLFNSAQGCSHILPVSLLSGYPHVRHRSPCVLEVILAACFSDFRLPASSFLFFYFPNENISWRGILVETKQCRYGELRYLSYEVVLGVKLMCQQI